MNRTICIDARLWGTRHTGIGRYIENLIANLPPAAVNQVVLIVPPDLKREPQLAKFTKLYASSHPYSLLSQAEMFFLLLKLRPGLLHVPHFTIPLLWPGRTVVTIHDLIKHISTGPATTTRSPLLYRLKYWGYLIIFKAAVRRSVRILVPAGFWKSELISRYHLPSDKIVVTNEGVNVQVFSAVPDHFTPPFTDPYVIYTGNLYPHKNVPLLLQSIKQLGGQMKLVIVCARSVFTDRLSRLVTGLSLQSDVRFVSSVTDSQLAGLYARARAFVTPSLIEGFGLPGLEAMAAGTPVLAARASCLPEIYGSAALYFDPHQAGELASLIKKVSASEKLRQDLIARGKAQIVKYSWVKMASLTWQTYQNALP